MSHIPIIIVVPRRDPNQYPPLKRQKMTPGEIGFICLLGLPAFFLYLRLPAYVMWYFMLAYVAAAIVYSRKTAAPSPVEQPEADPILVDPASFTTLALPVDGALPALCSYCGRETDRVVGLLAKQHAGPMPSAATVPRPREIEMLLHLPLCEACVGREPQLQVANFSARTMTLSVNPAFAEALAAMDAMAEAEAEAEQRKMLTMDGVKRRALAKRHKTV